MLISGCLVVPVSQADDKGLRSLIENKPVVAQEKTLKPCSQSKLADGRYDFKQQHPNYSDRVSTIGSVNTTRLEIFDESNEKENNWFFRAANKLHILTKDSAVRQELLFKEGDSFDQRLIDESARLVRDLNQLYDADIRVVGYCEQRTDIEVITRDAWSLNLDLSFDRSGGENNYNVGIGESNFLGRGKLIAMGHEKDTDRESDSITYKDNNVFGSRIRTHLRYSDSDDGYEQFARLQLPFYALDSKQAWDIRLKNAEEVNTQYFHGEDVSEIGRELQDYSFNYGFSGGLENGVTRRWRVGYRYTQEEFFSGPDLPSPFPPPVAKELSYPFIQYGAVEDEYTRSFNFEQINRNEDLHLGYSLRARFGYADEDFGSDTDRVIIDGRFSDTISYTDKVLLQHEITWEGLYNLKNDATEDVVISYSITYFHQQPHNRQFFTEFGAIWTDNLSSHRQVLLGGETGVRGYDKRFQSGDRRVHFTMEERQYTNYHLFSLAYLGFAAFVDIGRAWDPEIDENFEDDYLANVGFGIRLASSRTDSGRVIHLDVAFPLTNRDDPNVNDFEFTISAKNTL